MFSTSDATIVGTSELRKLGSKALQNIKSEKVILTQRGKPIGVIQDYEEYEKTENIITEFEDMVLGTLAQGRSNRKNKKQLSSEELQQLIFS